MQASCAIDHARSNLYYSIIINLACKVKPIPACWHLLARRQMLHVESLEVLHNNMDAWAQSWMILEVGISVSGIFLDPPATHIASMAPTLLINGAKSSTLSESVGRPKDWYCKTRRLALHPLTTPKQQALGIQEGQASPPSRAQLGRVPDRIYVKLIDASMQARSLHVFPANTGCIQPMRMETQEIS